MCDVQASGLAKGVGILVGSHVSESGEAAGSLGLLGEAPGRAGKQVLQVDPWHPPPVQHLHQALQLAEVQHCKCTVTVRPKLAEVQHCKCTVIVRPKSLHNEGKLLTGVCN